MTLEELERKLESVQNDQMVTFSSLDKSGMGFMTVKRIQSGQNYQVKMLFKYVDLLCNYIIVNGNVVENVERFGEYLQSLRLKKGLTTEASSARRI